jgi:hypothetical protein
LCCLEYHVGIRREVKVHTTGKTNLTGVAQMNRVMLACWRLGDGVYRRLRHFDFEDLNGSNIFRIRIRNYAGPAINLPNGSVVEDGDWVGFLHFYNMRLQGLLQGIQSDNRRGLVVAREVKRSLPELAEFIRRHPRGESPGYGLVSV